MEKGQIKAASKEITTLSLRRKVHIMAPPGSAGVKLGAKFTDGKLMIFGIFSLFFIYNAMQRDYVNATFMYLFRREVALLPRPPVVRSQVHEVQAHS